MTSHTMTSLSMTALSINSLNDQPSPVEDILARIAAADVLYGVTMEPGESSKVLSKRMTGVTV